MNNEKVIAKKKVVLKKRPVHVPETFTKSLNEQQLEAVLHDQGPAIVIAGAGSGKTRVLTYRVAWLLKNSVNPRSIMLVTFTKKSADEMIRRVKSLSNMSEKIIAGTFHHIANMFLRKYSVHVGFDSNFTILDRSDSEQLMKQILGAFLSKKSKEEKVRYPTQGTLVEMYSKSMNLHLQVKEVITQYYPQYAFLEKEVEVLFSQYFNRKKQNHVMDFDDLLVYFLRLLRTEGVREKIFKNIKHLLVDEFQDVNQIQADIINEIGQRARSVMVVGDDAQAIYSFRGANVKHMLEYEKNFDVPVKKYYLTINYRSTPEILKLANVSIQNNKNQFEKQLQAVRASGDLPEVIPCKDADQEADFICQAVLAARSEGIPFSEQAVLFRSQYHCIMLERALISYHIPYDKRAGLKFVELAHVKDVLSFCSILQNSANEIS
ncbi:MAG: ATP-dependent helicase, partial [Promethearchaeota archaeon]